MVLTILAIPFIILGVLISPYSLEAARCIALGFASKGGYCFEQGSHMPETIKYGCVLFGFALLYAGRRQIKHKRGLE
jgi:hypothetical protein